MAWPISLTYYPHLIPLTAIQYNVNPSEGTYTDTNPESDQIPMSLHEHVYANVKPSVEDARVRALVRRGIDQRVQQLEAQYQAHLRQLRANRVNGGPKRKRVR